MNLSKKLEINLTVDLVGPLEPLKPFLIDSVLLLDKKTKPKSLLKTYYLVVEVFSLVEMDVTEDTPLEPGTTTLKPD